MTFQLLKVGTDTEFFLRDAKTNLPVTAIGRFGGTKNKPKPVLDIPGFCIQEDNVMPEVNIPACSEAGEFTTHCERILDWLRQEAKKQGLKVDISPSMKFTADQLKHPQAKNIGCEADYCVWTQSQNEFDVAKRAILEFLRSAGAHVHVSFKHTKRRITEEDKELCVMFLDLNLGVPSVLLDDDLERKKLYGKAGSFRMKEYGVEYRVLSNFWWKKAQYMYWIFNGVQRSIEAMNDKGMIRVLYDKGEQIQDAINTQNIHKAQHIMNHFGIRTP